MASDSEASCENDPNFAVICAFIEKFGAQCGLPPVDFLALQGALENTDEVPPHLTQLILTLLKRVKRSVKNDKWEKALVNVCHNFSSQDAWEVERFGFKKAKLSSKVRVLKELLEMQFDYHIKFKNGVNKLTAEELRSHPLGRDKAGHAYWFQSDENYQIRVYKEDLDEETWTLIAKDRDSLVSLIEKLSDGDSKFSSDSAANEDSNSLSEKPVIDTGQIDSDTKPSSEDNDETRDVTDSKKKDDELEVKAESKNDEKSDGVKQNSRPLLRIKNISELMSDNLKRAKSDPDDEQPREKVLKVEIEKLKEKAPVEEAIEEPVMRIQGEGSGEENEGVNVLGDSSANRFENLENVFPIVGETIEENVMYFYGEGTGSECLTGNEEKGSSSETLPNSQVITEDKCVENSSLPDSISDNVGDFKDNNFKTKEVPHFKLGTIIDTKTDNNVNKSPAGPSRKSRWDVEVAEDSQSDSKLENPEVVMGKVKGLVNKFERACSPTFDESTSENKSPPSTPKKPTFFFGSPSVKANSLSPSLTIGFGQNSPHKNTDDVPNDICLEKTENEDDNINSEEISTDLQKNKECKDRNVIKHSIENLSRQIFPSNDPVNNSDKINKDFILHKDEANINVGSKNCEKNIESSDTKNEKEKADDNEMNNSEIKGKVENHEKKLETGKQKDPDIDGKIEKGKVEELPVEEPICIKKKAYVCGDDTEKDNDLNSDISNIKENPDLINEEAKCDKEKGQEVIPNIVGKATECEVKSKKNLKDEQTTQGNESLNDTVKEPSNDNQGDDKLEPVKINETIVKETRQVSLRSVRSKKVATLNNSNKNQKVPPVPNVDKCLEESEKIYPDTRSKVKKTNEKPLDMPSKHQIENSKGEDTGTIKNSSVEKKLDAKTKKKGIRNLPSADSSHVNSPISVSDSIILLPDSPENSVDFAMKDPLANSEEEASPQKPMNLLSLSLDFNESSTPPPIPVIPSRRTLRKRGREVSPEVVKKAATSPGKKMKLKGKRQVDTKLRKSIEQKKQQQVSSSDEEEKVSEDEKSGSKSRKKNQQKQKNKKKVAVSDDDSGTPVPKPKKKNNNRNSRILANLGITNDKPFESVGVRQSRRLAQMKIKEQADCKNVEKVVKEEKKKKKVEDKEYKVEKVKKLKEQKPKKEESPESEPEDLKKRKKKKFKAPNKIFDEKKPWMSSSESSECEEDVEEEEEAIEEDEPLVFKSDHEFSPESDLEGDGESQPLKRARTARKNYEECDEAEGGDDCPCQKCGKSDHPEWILLCDKCDNGWHCSCLRPPLLVIPEGDWYCPPCQHIRLVQSLQAKLTEYDKKLSKKEIEDRRKERLAYVGISLNNVLPSREHEQKKKRRHSTQLISSSGESERSESDSESDSDEPIYQLRQRRQAKSYKFNEYDDLIKSAIQDEINEKGLETLHQSRGKDIATIVKAEEEERKEKEQEKSEKDEKVVPEEKPPVVPPEKKEYSDDDEIKPPVKRARKKTRKINNLDVSSEEDDERDEDFKGTSSESEEEDPDEEEESEDSDDYTGRGGKKRKNLRPVRRSTRTRVSRFDADFINDSDFDDAPRKKKKKKYWSETDSEESDRSWGRRKKGRSSMAFRKKSKKKKSILDELSDIEPLKKKKPKIKYGGLTSSDEDMGRGRRTRGKKTTYVDTLGSDSEEENRKKNPRRIDSDDEDFVANDEEKDSEVEEDGDEEDDQVKQEEASGRRPLIVPKIYIKKPPVAKEVERPKERVPPVKINKETDESESIKKPVEQTAKSDSKEPEPVEKVTSLEEEVKKEPENLQPKQQNNVVEEKPKSVEENKISKENEEEAVTKPPEKTNTDKKVENPIDDDELDNPIEKINKKLEDMDSDEMEKMMEEEEFATKQLQLVALQLEKEKKRKAEEAKRLETETKTVAPPVPAKRGRKPKPKEAPRLPASVLHEPIVSNVKALICNDNDNDELSEPPGVTLPLFEELTSRKNEEEVPKRGRGRGRSKKTLEETLANLGGRKNLSNKTPLPENTSQAATPAGCNIEIAAPPQPFSQESPTPSVITRMLQSKPGQTTAYPVGSIRPKQFATMPDDDDDSPSSRSRGSSPSASSIHIPAPPPGQYIPGPPRGPVGPPFRPLHQGMNHYPRGAIPPPHAMRGPGPPTMPPHLYHPHRALDPSPSGGGPINMSESNPTQMTPPPPTSSPGSKMEPHNYSRTSSSSSRFPPLSSASNIPLTPPRPIHMLSHMQQSRPSNLSPYPSPHPPPTNYYGGYPPETMANEDAMPPTVFQNSPYPEQFPAEVGAEPSENSNSKSYGDESGGEFGGLVSYFSSQREDDLES